jgi:threonine/homoserine/homoserine lactone efflux protein
MAASSTAFTVLKWVGAAYLFYVGLKLVMSKSPPPVELIAEKPIQTSDGALKSIFFRGFLTNVLNPKVALFFLAFVPQFIAPNASHPALTFVLLGVLFNVNALPINVGYALLAAWAMRRMGAVQCAMHWLDRLAGVMFVGFGIKLALAEVPQP